MERASIRIDRESHAQRQSTTGGIMTAPMETQTTIELEANARPTAQAGAGGRGAMAHGARLRHQATRQAPGRGEAQTAAA